MPSYLQIQGDPTQWWLDQPLDSSQLTEPAVSIHVTAPLAGTLVLSARSASIAIINQPSDVAIPGHLEVLAPAVYLPTPTGPSAGSTGYELARSADPLSLAEKISALMRDGRSLAIPLGGAASGGSLVLNGASLSFVVLCAPMARGPIPSDGSPS